MTKILMIDDENDLLFTYATAMRASELEVVTASDGATGLELAAKEKPDLISLDLSMSPMDGFTVLEKLKLDPELKKIPVVIFTNMTRAGLYDELIGRGADFFCEKTDYNPRQFVDKIKEALKIN